MVGKEVDGCGGRRCYCERGMWRVEVELFVCLLPSCFVLQKEL